MDNLQFSLVLTAVNRFSGVFNQLNDKTSKLRKDMDKLRESSERFGRVMAAAGAAGAYAMSKPIQAFAELEDASVRLKTVMMDKNGMIGAFEQVNALAVKLGDRMPGTTADFLNMMSTLKAYDITDASILGGVGEAAANLAVLLKMAPEAAAEFAAKMKTATGTVDRDMMGLMDTIQRLNFMGVDSTEMMYAFGRSGGALKTFRIQGLEATRALAPLYAMLVKGGLSGETVGTGFASLLSNMADKTKLGKANALLGPGMKLDLFGKDGQLKPIRDVVAQFDKLKNLDPIKLNAVLKELTGGGQDQQMLAQIITNGVEGYDKIVIAMQKQADLEKRVAAQLSTLANLWEAATGTFRNTLAGFAEAMGPQLKELAQWFGKVSASVGAFIKENPVLAKWIGIISLAAIAAAMVLGTLALAVSGVIGTFLNLKIAAFALLRVFLLMMATPLGAALMLIAGAAFLIWKNWDWLKKQFTSFWEWLTTNASRVAEMLMTVLSPFKAAKWLVDQAIELTAPATSRPRAPSATGAGPQQVGGKVTVDIHDKRVSVREVKSDNPRVPVQADVGRMFTIP